MKLCIFILRYTSINASLCNKLYAFWFSNILHCVTFNILYVSWTIYTLTDYAQHVCLACLYWYIQLSAKVYIHLSRRNKTKVVVIMNHYNTTTFTWNVNEGMQIVIVVLYCHINSITIVILVVDCFYNKSLRVKNVHTTKTEPMDMGWSVSNDLPNYLR